MLLNAYSVEYKCETATRTLHTENGVNYSNLCDARDATSTTESKAIWRMRVLFLSLLSLLPPLPLHLWKSNPQIPITMNKITIATKAKITRPNLTFFHHIER